MPAIEVVQPEEVGLSRERLGRIDQHLERRYLAPGKIAGALTLVARRDRVAFCSPLGQMDLARGKAMAEDTIFRIYSMTKPITSVALMMLYEEASARNRSFASSLGSISSCVFLLVETQCRICARKSRAIFGYCPTTLLVSPGSF